MAVGLVKWVHGLLIVLPFISLWQNRDVWVDADAVTLFGLMICLSGTDELICRMALMGCLLFLWDFGSSVQLVVARPIQGTDVQKFLRGSCAGEDCSAQISGTVGWTKGVVWDLCSWTCGAAWDFLVKILRDLSTEFCLTADSVEECRDMRLGVGTILFRSAIACFCMVAQGPLQWTRRCCDRI